MTSRIQTCNRHVHIIFCNRLVLSGIPGLEDDKPAPPPAPEPSTSPSTSPRTSPRTPSGSGGEGIYEEETESSYDDEDFGRVLVPGGALRYVQGS